jgi:kinesin family protein 2/24
MSVTDQKCLDLERYRRTVATRPERRGIPSSTAKSSLPGPTSASSKPSSSTKSCSNKIVSTCDELEGQLENTKPQTPRSAPTPLSRKIRQQILKSDKTPSPAPHTPHVSSSLTRATASSAAARRARLEKHRNIVSHRTTLSRDSRSQRSSVTAGTPVNNAAALPNTAFFTPSPRAVSNLSPKDTRGVPRPATTSRKTTRHAGSPNTNETQLVVSGFTATPNRTRATKSPRSQQTTNSAPTNSIRDGRISSRSPRADRLTPSHRTPLHSTTRDTNQQRSISKDDEQPSTRRNLDKRSARLKFADEFAGEISRCRALTAKLKAIPKQPAAPDIPVYIRKRPIFPDELENGDFDVVEKLEDGIVTIYKASMQPDMRTKTVQPFSLAFSHVFDEVASNEDIYKTVVHPLVLEAQAGGKSTLLCFGQTGSGKTYSMTAMERFVAEELFLCNRQEPQCDKAEVVLQCLELSGKLCRDLIGNSEVRVMEQGDNTVHFVNAESVSVSSVEDLMQALAQAKARRATQSTERNDVSSRSHGVCQISLKTGGRLLLVDCAGTERRHDSLYHDRARQAESAEINASLYALKKCLRARAARDAHVSYRSSLLTRVLRDTLENPNSKLAILATIAPNGTDFEHSFETLMAVAQLYNTTCEAGPVRTIRTESAECRAVAPKNWTHEQLVSWMKQKRLWNGCEQKISPALNGRQVMRMSKIHLRNAFYEDSEWQKADLLFNLLRAETDRVARMELKRRISSKAVAST